MSNKLLNIRIDYIRIDQAVDQIEKWLKKKGKHFVVTPNPEMLVDAGRDPYFREALNSADLAIPDSLRLGWGNYIQAVSSPLLRLMYVPTFLLPHILPGFNYPKTTGVDLMERLLSLSSEKGFKTAYLGGSPKVADRLFKCLRTKFPGLKIVFCSGNMAVNSDGDIEFDSQRYKTTGSKDIKSKIVPDKSFNHHLLVEKIDIMFVAFGHKKQEKWMYKNLPKLNTRVMVGVGGAFDYISGEVPRAPGIMRNLGLEWLFRVIVQPWRLKRFWKLFYFVYMVLRGK